jgi:hypothetical protein
VRAAGTRFGKLLRIGETPFDLVEDANVGRLPKLVPIRNGRMMLSPFTFYRGTALNMASDLATTPTTGVRVQVCGDANAIVQRHFLGLDIR